MVGMEFWRLVAVALLFDAAGVDTEQRIYWAVTDQTGDERYKA
jgi:hypothetical protein